MSRQHNIFLPESEFFTGGDAYLLLHQVDTGNHFCHRMFDLNTGVHFDEIKLTGFIKKFKGACTAIANLATGFSAAITNFLYQLAWNARRRRFFDNFLVSALHRAIALAQPDCVFEFIGKYLDFVLVLLLAGGVSFEVPIAVLVAVLLGWVKVEQLVEWRGYVIVAIFIIAAIITPPDGLSQIMLALPMWGLYEVGIVASRMLLKARARNAPPPSAE